MTLEEIVTQSRYRLNNFTTPYYWGDSELVFYANEAVNIICRDGFILEDSSTASVCQIPLVANQLDYSLSALVLYVRSAQIITEEVLTLDVAPSTAWAEDATITGATSNKTCVIVENLTSTTYKVEQRSGTFTLGEILSDGTHAADQGAAYPTFAGYTYSQPLTKTTAYEMNQYYAGWRSATAGEPTKYLLDYTHGYLTVYPKPDVPYILSLSVYRYPATAFTSTAMSSQTPEIPSQYHSNIIDGICWQAWQKAGDITYDQQRSDQAFRKFRQAIANMKRDNVFFHGNAYTSGLKGGFI